MKEMPMRISLVMAVALVGCKSGKSTIPGLGPEVDARLVSDVFTWTCASEDTGGNVLDEWQGVFAQEVSLAYAPDLIEDLSLPSAGGCTADLDMFPIDAGSGGASIVDLSGDPEWATAADAGKLKEKGAGFWSDDVFAGTFGCQDVEDVLAGGTELTSAAGLTGALTPEPEEVPAVSFGAAEDGEAVAWGSTFDISWESHGWDETWIQVRREFEGEPWEAVTCNATGSDSFTMSADVWGLMDSGLTVDVNNLYVGFQKTEEQIMDDGTKVEVHTRAISVAVVPE
jgi:hypothetical protein